MKTDPLKTSLGQLTRYEHSGANETQGTGRARVPAGLSPTAVTEGVSVSGPSDLSALGITFVGITRGIREMGGVKRAHDKILILMSKIREHHCLATDILMATCNQVC